MFLIEITIFEVWWGNYADVRILIFPLVVQYEDSISQINTSPAVSGETYRLC